MIKRVIFTFLAIMMVVMSSISLNAEETRSTSDSDRIIITAEEIKKLNVRTITELLNQMPGLSASESSVSLRGSRMVRVLLDGRPINDPLSGHRAIKWNLVSLNDIEKIEIYKGSGAVAFGDDTSGGVISIRTKRIKGSQGNIEASLGNFNTQNYSLNYRQDMNAGKSNSLDASASVEGASNGVSPFGLGVSLGWDKTDGFRKNGDKDKKRMGVKGSYNSSKECSFDLSFDYSEEDRGMPGLPAFPTPRARSEYETFASSLTGKFNQLKSCTYFSRFHKEHRNPDRGLETILKSWSLGEAIRSSVTLDKWGAFNTGLNVEIAQVEGNKVKSQQEEKAGLFVAKEFEFESLPLTLGTGLRWNWYSEFQQVVNPEIKLGYDRGNFGIQGSISKTNNTPTFLQRYYESSTTRPNPDLGMEKSMNYTLAFTYQRDKALEGNLSFFYNEIEDRITYVRGEGGIGSYENFGETTRKGAELSIKWKPRKYLEIKPSYIYLLAKDERTDYWLPCKPEHTARVGLLYKAFADLTLAMDTKYVSKQYTRSDNKESVPGYSLTDFRADYYLKKARLFLKIENLFDKDYYYGDGYPAPPMTWLVGLSYEL